MSACSVSGCARPYRCNGLCALHYSRSLAGRDLATGLKGRPLSLQERFESHCIPEPNTGCWLWIGATGSDGYGKAIVDGRSRRAHRVSWEMFRGEIPPDVVICHRCDNPPCVNPSHLFLGTQLDNIADRHSKGRSAGPRGVLNPNAKLNPKAVREIRELRARGLLLREIAARVGVSRTSVRNALSGKTWASSAEANP